MSWVGVREVVEYFPAVGGSPPTNMHALTNMWHMLFETATMTMDGDDDADADYGHDGDGGDDNADINDDVEDWLGLLENEMRVTLDNLLRMECMSESEKEKFLAAIFERHFG